jgi:undecaprenyl-diphosphatase
VWRRIWKLILWLGGHEMAVLAGLLLIVAGTWAFIALGDRISEGSAPAFDTWLLKSLRRPDNPAVPIGPPMLPEVARDITALGSAMILVLVTGAVSGFLLLDRKFSALGFVLLATILGFLLSEVLKQVYGRPRPDVVPQLTRVWNSSFPSGHSMMSAVVYLTLGTLLTRFVTRRWLKFYFLAVAVLVTFMVGVTRVYLGVHYPTDVLAGWAAGLAWAMLCGLVARYLQRRGALETKL